MFDDPAQIVRFWQAVEIFSPQNLPKRNTRTHVRDFRDGDIMPWEPGSRLPPPDPGKIWRHEGFGGVYTLSKVRDLLVAAFGDDDPESAVKGESALFACTVDGNGFLVEGSTVLSMCAWACGQLVRDRSPFSGFRNDADELEELAGTSVLSPLRLLAGAIRGLIPDAVSAGIASIVANALAILGGPLAAAGGAAAGGLASRATNALTGGGEGGSGSEPTLRVRLDAGALMANDLQSFTAMMARRLGVKDALEPRNVRVRSYQIPPNRAEEEPETSFLNSFIADDLANVAWALTQRNAGRALISYLTPARHIDESLRTDVQREPLRALDGLAPDRLPEGRWVTNTDRPLVFSQQFAVNQAMTELCESGGLFAVNGPPGTGKTTMLRELIAAIVVNRATWLAELADPGQAFCGSAYRWETAAYSHQIWAPIPELTGFEIAVASSNNGAVENVTTEIPGAKGIGEEFLDAAANVDYFAETARIVHGDGAWAMVAARLGKRKYRNEFADRFWWKSMRFVLSRPVAPGWPATVARFDAARAEVQKLYVERTEMDQALIRLPSDSSLAGIVDDAICRWGNRVPYGPEYEEIAARDLIERREKSAPWADEELAGARTELFLAALALHKALILAEAPTFWSNLNALTAILQGKGYPDDPQATLAAWQTFFLVVPVVSSTFASFDKLFAGLGRECLGWLLIDEAGQAAPQNAAGALWRARRGVIVGDPLQLQPVVTLPWGGQRVLLEEFAVSTEWAPSRTSVQQIADQHARHGTRLPASASGDRIWVGTPLRVHRRCDRPMFDISNTIAYDGLMVYGTDERAPFHGNDGWIDIRSSVAEGHWIPAEGEALRAVLSDLRAAKVPASDIRILAPFRMVAEGASKIHGEIFPEVTGKKRDEWVGTVHTMQGKEADVVILVRGGDPRKPGAREFATKSPNLLNVAVTRAKRRLYIIGNRDAWGRDGCFTTLAEGIPVAQAPGSAGPDEWTEGVWRTPHGRKYHITPSCEALQEGMRKAEQAGRRVSQPRQVQLRTAFADGLAECRRCYPDQTPR